MIYDPEPDLFFCFSRIYCTFIKKLDTYLQEYDNIYNIQVIDDNIHKSKQLILDQFKL